MKTIFIGFNKLCNPVLHVQMYLEKYNTMHVVYVQFRKYALLELKNVAICCPWLKFSFENQYK